MLTVCGSLILLSTSARAQVPPPAQLPRYIEECKFGTHYSACGIWTWNGSSYAATWWNGANAQITVTGSPANLQMHRTDTSGPLSGLTATYTGRWNEPPQGNAEILFITPTLQAKGSVVSDGKMSFQFKGVSASATWSASPAIAPVSKNPDVRVPGIANYHTAPLSAFAVNNTLRGAADQINTGMGLGASITDFRTLNQKPMAPYETRKNFSLGVTIVPPNFVKGAAYPSGAVIAAIYTDGTTLGDANIIGAMMERRRDMSDSLNSIETTVCTLGARQMSIGDIAGALGKQHDAENTRSPAKTTGRDAAYNLAFQNMRPILTYTRQPPSKAAATLLGMIESWRTALADPVKDSTGQLIVPTPKPSSCGLP
jgi:hypothetical protein